MGGVQERVGEKHIITFDMGGTTAKLGAVDNGRLAIRRSRSGMCSLKKVADFQLTCLLLTYEIGAGGGSIASVNMGIITIGPESAKNPGPYARACGKHPCNRC